MAPPFPSSPWFEAIDLADFPVRGTGLLAALALGLLAGCATPQPHEQIVRAWNFDPGGFNLPPGEFTHVQIAGEGKFMHVAQAIRTRDGASLLVQLPVQPPQPVGSPARLRFRCRLSGASKLTVQMFDLTSEDNRHIELPDLASDTWLSFDLDFTRDSRRNDRTRDTFAAGHRVDDVFFFVHGAPPDSRLQVDDVVLYSPAKP
jgi:hypothetical protein